MKNQLAPVVLFTYKRLDTLKQTIESLRNNKLAKESALYIYSDGAKSEHDLDAVVAVRLFLQSIVGFKSVTIKEANSNLGLANSVIQGVTEVIGEYGRVIVLEDDLLLSQSFLSYMNQALRYYERVDSVMSISGYNMVIPLKHKKDVDVFFTKRAASWGWATWKNKWEGIDWNVEDYKVFRQDVKKQREFNLMGSDMAGMLEKQQRGENNSWAIRYCYHQFRHNLYTVYPFISLVKNIGFTKDATHTSQVFNRFDVELDNNYKDDFIFTSQVELNSAIIQDFAKINGYWKRFKSRLYNLILK